MVSEGGIRGELIVNMTKKEVVAAALPLQEHWLPLSNLDLLLPPVDVGVFFCYKKCGKDLTFGSMVGVLKKALAQALLTYYAFAGEVVSNPFGEPEILCNNRGVEFVEASAEVELKDLNLYNPDDTIEGKLVPKKKQGVLAVQVCDSHVLNVCNDKYTCKLAYTHRIRTNNNHMSQSYIRINIFYLILFIHIIISLLFKSET